MTWKVDGKIAMNFPGSGVPNRDTYQIRFAPTGCSAESQILEIEKVYFVPAGVTITQANLSQYLVWHRYWDAPSYVPYDNTCSAIVTLSQDKKSWIITIIKDGEDVTSSLSQMITWIYNGKGERVDPQYAYSNTVDLSQFPRGDYRLDLSRITSKAGGYFPGSGSISVPDHIYIGTLLAGDMNVAIELDLTNAASDLTVTSIEIFTSQTTSSTAGRIKIIHSSGLYVGAVDGNTTDSSTEKYNLTGVPRSNDTVSVTLYAGEKYYLVFNDGNTSLYYPAYFQNENGNYIANFVDNAQASTLHPYQNITAIKAYLPASGGDIAEADLKSILELDTNELFLWNGNNLTVNSTVIINDDHLGKKLTSKVTDPPITTSDVDIWSYGNQQIFIRHGYGSDVVNRIWKKTATTSNDGSFSTTSSNGTISSAEILLALKNGTGTYSKILADTPEHHGGDPWWSYVGSKMSLRSGYKVGLTDMTPLTTVPQNPENNTFYYFAQSIAESTVGTWSDTIVVYENNTWKALTAYGGADNFKPYVNSQSLDSVIEQISLTTLVQEDQQVSCNSSVKTATISNTRKYYVKLNGKEFP